MVAEVAAVEQRADKAEKAHGICQSPKGPSTTVDGKNPT